MSLVFRPRIRTLLPWASLGVVLLLGACASLAPEGCYPLGGAILLDLDFFPDRPR